ncbi:hypothetical protein ACM55H_15455 [Flavobacterium sp. ZT3R17]|uniref:hypothetical protein n=1 Tax=Flavobacterium cryoconiti TaxID=3398736 RepID=UPI003A8B2E48
MTKINILYISPNKYNSNEVLELINANESWHGFVANNEEEAVLLFLEFNMAMILFGCDVNKKTEIKLCHYFKEINPTIIILEPYGGGTGLLTHEIISAFNKDESL